MPATDTEATAGFLAVFERRDACGSLHFSDEDILNFLPQVFMRLKKTVPDFELPPQIERFLGRFALKIGVGPDLEPEAARAKIRAHYAENPVHSELEALFEEALRDAAAHGASDRLEAFIRFAGERVSHEAYREHAPRPEGTMTASPFARFRLGSLLNPDP